MARLVEGADRSMKTAGAKQTTTTAIITVLTNICENREKEGRHNGYKHQHK